MAFKMEKIQKKLRCFICKSVEIFFITEFFRGGKIYGCRKCQNAFTVPQPDFKYSNTEKFVFKESSYREAESISKRILEFINKFITQGKFLDIGSGVGSLIDLANKNGFLAEGIEPSLPAVNLCRKKGLQVKKGYFEKAQYKADAFNIVTLSHVLEHIENPGKFLSKVSRVLKKDGFLFLAQTNYKGTIPEILGKFWEGWVTDQHFVHFSPEGIKYFLKNHNFRPVKIELVSGYKLLWRWGNMGTIFNNIYYSVNFILSVILGNTGFKGDQMYVIARKI